MYGLKERVTISVDSNLLKNLDKRTKELYGGHFKRIQRSKVIGRIIELYLNKFENKK